MEESLALYSVLGICIVLLALIVIYFLFKTPHTKPLSPEGFQEAPLPTVDSTLLTSQLRTYFSDVSGYAIDLTGKPIVNEETALKTSKSYSFVDFEKVKSYIYKNYIVIDTLYNLRTGELEAARYMEPENKIEKYYNTVINLMTIQLYGPLRTNSFGKQENNFEIGLIGVAENLKGNDSTKYSQEAANAGHKSNYGQKALEFNTTMRDLYSEMAQQTTVNAIYDYEFKQLINTTVETFDKVGAFNYYMSAESFGFNTSSGYSQLNEYSKLKNGLTQDVKDSLTAMETDYRTGKYYIVPNLRAPSSKPSTRLLDEAQFQGTVYYHGTVSAAALQDLQTSYKLCRRTFLGNERAISLFVYIDPETLKPYLRNETTTYFCQDPVLEYINTENNTAYKFKTTFQFPGLPATVSDEQSKYAPKSSLIPTFKNYVADVCTEELTTDKLMLFPFHARAFLKTYIYNTQKRYVEIWKAGGTTKTQPEKMKDSSTAFNVADRVFLDKLAQSFYEMTDGSYTMTNIYDVFQIGKTILDVRFDIRRHGDPSEIQNQIDAITKTFQDLQKSNIDAAALASARSDYLNKLYELQAKQDENMGRPRDGCLARFFVTGTSAENFSIQGITLDRRAVTTFRQELNCGMYTTIGGAPGLINYVPTVRFYKNRTTPINCTDPDSLRRIMADYEEAAITDLSGQFMNIAGSGRPPPPGGYWDISGSERLQVETITGAQQLNDYQCAIKWNEAIYDATTNEKKRVITNRRAIISYVKNVSEWYANQNVFDASGFQWLNGDTGSTCIFNSTEYARRYMGNPNKASEAKAHYVSTGFAKGYSPCPDINPYARFDPTSYRYVNTAINQSVGANRKRLQEHYLKGLFGGKSGIEDDKPVASKWNIQALSKAVDISGRLMADGSLTDGGVCPSRSCSDPDVLTKLMDDYNTNPDKPGVILRILKTMTTGANQCDVEAEIDFDRDKVLKNKGLGPAPGPAPGPASRESFQSGGTAANTSTNTGIQQKTFSMSVDLNTNTCQYKLAGADVNKSIFTIQDNTPPLYKPATYGDYIESSNKQLIEPTLVPAEKRAKSTFEEIKKALTEYRIKSNTGSAELSELEFEGCPGLRCDDELLMSKFLRQVGNAIPASSYISKILKAVALTDPSGGTVNCEYTVNEETWGYTKPYQAGAERLATQTKAYRCEATQPRPGDCSLVFKSFKNITPTMTPEWAQVQDVKAGLDEYWMRYMIPLLQTYAKFSDVMTNYTNLTPKRFTSFTGRKFKALLRTKLNAGQLISRRAIDISTCYIKYYLRDTKNNRVDQASGIKEVVATFKVDENYVTSMNTRAPRSGDSGRGFPVGVDNQPLLEEVTFNFDEVNCKKTFNCKDIETAFGFKVAASVKINPEICEVRLTDDESRAISDNYLKVAVYTETENNCDLTLNTIVPSTAESTVMGKLPPYSNSLFIGTASTQGLIRKMFNEKYAGSTMNPRRVLGTIMQGQTLPDGAILYKITMAEYDQMKPANMIGYYDDGRFSTPAYIRCDLRKRFKTDGSVYISKFTLLTTYDDPKTGFKDINDPGATQLDNPEQAIRRFKYLQFIPNLARSGSSTVAQFTRIQFFDGQQVVSFTGAEFSVVKNGTTLSVNASSLFGSDPMTIAKPEESAIVDVPLKAAISIKTKTMITPTGVSFMTGTDIQKDCISWTIRGSLNGIFWKTLFDTNGSVNYSGFGSWRLPIIPFDTTKQASVLPQNPNRLQGIVELRVAPTDIRVVNDAARLIYMAVSSRLFGAKFQSSEPMVNRCFLSGINGVAAKADENAVLVKPQLMIVDERYTIQRALTTNFVIIVVYQLKRASDASRTLTLDTTKTRIVGTTDYLSYPGYQSFPAQPTGMLPTDKVPFGFGGLPMAMRRFNDMGAMKFAGRLNTDPIPNILKLDNYTVATPTTLIQKQHNSTTYTNLSREGAAVICNGNADCVGFFENADGNSGVFFKAPTPDTRIVAVEEKKMQGKNIFGEDAVLSFNHLYLKTGVILFRFVRFRNIRPRVNGTSRVRLGKMAFYKGTTRFSMTIQKAMVNGAETTAIATAPSQLFAYQNLGTFWEAWAPVSELYFEFAAPISADGYTFVTATTPTPDYDPVEWVFETSLDGQNWVVVHQKTGVAAPVTRTTSYGLFKFDPKMTDSAVTDFDPKTLDSCNTGCTTSAVLDKLTDKYYRERAPLGADPSKSTDAMVAVHNPFNVTRVGYQSGSSECILEYDTGTGQPSQSIGFRINPTLGNCTDITNSDNITLNTPPTTQNVALNRLPVQATDKFRYVRFRPALMIGGRTTNTEIGKIALFDADGKMLPSATYKKAVSTTSSATTDNPASNTILYTSRDTAWKEAGLSVLILELDTTKVKFPLSAFTLRAGPTLANNPAQWTLEASTDGRFWKLLHSTATHRRISPPQAAQGQYAKFPFQATIDPSTIPDILDRKMDEFGQSCTSPEILDQVSDILSKRNPAVYFDPVSFRYDRATNRCDYMQRDGTSITTFFETAAERMAFITSQTTLKEAEIPSKQALAGSTAAIAPQLKGLDNCTPKLLCDDPTTLNTFRQKFESATQAPFSARGFGLDSARNECVFQLDDAYKNPLLQSDKVGFQFRKQVDCKSPPEFLRVDTGLTTAYANPNIRSKVEAGPYKFIRFRVTKVYDPTVTGYNIGGITFYKGSAALTLPTGTTVRMNPTDTTTINLSQLTTQGIFNYSALPIVFQLPTPLDFDSYAWKSGSPVTGIVTSASADFRYDPVRWKLEGSTTGVFWTVLHEQAEDYANSQIVSVGGIVTKQPCKLSRSTVQGPFTISTTTPVRNFAATKCEVPEPLSYDIESAGFKCNSRSVWNLFTTAFRRLAAQDTPVLDQFGNRIFNIVMDPPATDTIKSAPFKYAFDKDSNTCHYAYYPTAVKFAPSTNTLVSAPTLLPNSVKYVSAIFPKTLVTDQASYTIPDGKTVDITRLDEEVPVKTPTVPIVPIV